MGRRDFKEPTECVAAEVQARLCRPFRAPAGAYTDPGLREYAHPGLKNAAPSGLDQSASTGTPGEAWAERAARQTCFRLKAETCHPEGESASGGSVGFLPEKTGAPRQAISAEFS